MIAAAGWRVGDDQPEGSRWSTAGDDAQVVHLVTEAGARLTPNGGYPLTAACATGVGAVPGDLG